MKEWISRQRQGRQRIKRESGESTIGYQSTENREGEEWGEMDDISFHLTTRVDCDTVNSANPSSSSNLNTASIMMKIACDILLVIYN